MLPLLTVINFVYLPIARSLTISGNSSLCHERSSFSFGDEFKLININEIDKAINLGYAGKQLKVE